MVYSDGAPARGFISVIITIDQVNNDRYVMYMHELDFWKGATIMVGLLLLRLAVLSQTPAVSPAPASVSSDPPPSPAPLCQTD